MRIPIVLLLLCLLPAISVYGIEGDSLWSQTYGGEREDIAYNVVETNDGGFLLSGEINGNMGFVKTDHNGGFLWSRSYDWALFARGSLALPNNHYVICGVVYPGTSFLGEFDENGDSLWIMFIDYFWVNAILKTDSGYLLAGEDSFYDPVGNMGLIETDINGSLICWRSYGRPMMEEAATSIILTTDSGYLMSGWSTLNPNGESNIFILKTNANYDSIWSRAYGSTLYEVAYASLTLNDGYLLGGGTGISQIPDEMLWMKINLQGDSLWARTYGSPEPGDETIYSITEAGNSQYLLAGVSALQSGDMCLIKINSLGDTIWTRTYGGVGNEVAFSSIISDANCLLAGFAQPFGADDVDMWLLCVEGPFLGIAPVEPITFPHSFVFNNPCPNPFNSSTVINLQLSTLSQVKLTVWDTAGRLVSTLIEGEVSGGQHQITFDGLGLGSGVYFVKLEASSGTSTTPVTEVKKVVLLR